MHRHWLRALVFSLVFVGKGHAQIPMPPEALPLTWNAGEDCPSPATWVQGDYLLWWVSPAPVPAPLITTGPPASQGALLSPGTQVLFGDSREGLATFSGLRLGAGRWLDDCQRFGVEASGFLLEQRSTGLALHSDAAGSPLLATPFIGITPAGIGETSLRSSSPGQFVGGTAAGLSTRLWGAEANGLWRPERSSPWQLLAGFTTISLEEALERVTNNETLAALRSDHYGTRNQFYGGQIGVRGAWQFNRLELGLLAKTALGWTHEVVSQDGNLIRPDGTTLPGGVLIENGDLGTYTRNHFAVVPEGRVRLSYAFTANLLASVGYNVLYVSNVVRPGDQIERVINVGNLPQVTRFGPVQPMPGSPVSIQSTDFWAHGLNFGLELRF